MIAYLEPTEMKQQAVIIINIIQKKTYCITLPNTFLRSLTVIHTQGGEQSRCIIAHLQMKKFLSPRRGSDLSKVT